MQTTFVKVGDEALEIILNCMELVRRDTSLIGIIKDHALIRLTHVFGYLISDQLGEYRNGY